MLIGVGLVVLAILSALVMLPRRSAGLHRVQQSKDGTTWVDLSQWPARSAIIADERQRDRSP
jgi:hypothetical protein